MNSLEKQPLSNLTWIPPGELYSNEYNPNRVFPEEMELLKRSILEDGWVQPIYARQDGEIIDGFHRWTLASTDEEVAALTGGLVPVVHARENIDRVGQRAATVRLNRARGYHGILNMSKLVHELTEEHGLSTEDFRRVFGMEKEEVNRLLDAGGDLMPDDEEEFSEGWVVADPQRHGG